MVPSFISQRLNNSGLYPKPKMVIFAKIADFNEFRSHEGHKQEAEIPQHQEQGRILIPGVACVSALLSQLLLNFLNHLLYQAIVQSAVSNRQSAIKSFTAGD